jgi:hypothetical protein
MPKTKADTSIALLRPQWIPGRQSGCHGKPFLERHAAAIYEMVSSILQMVLQNATSPSRVIRYFPHKSLFSSWHMESFQKNRMSRHEGETFGCLPAQFSSFCLRVMISNPSRHIEFMPKRGGLKGATPREKREYEHIKKSAQRSGRYGKRAKEVAARTVMKRHGKH